MIGECGKEKENSKEKWLVLLLLLILLLLGIVIGMLLSQRGKGVSHRKRYTNSSDCSTANSGEGVGLVIDPNAESGQSSENNNTTEQDVAISGRGSMTFPANKKEVTVDFYNPKENEGLYYMTFELRLNNDSEQGYEVLYTSELVEPGKHINRISLSRALEKGVYEAVVHVQPYRMKEEKTLTNNADMKTRLIVK